ncbi:MAG: DegT/DnrJ/EryC1/StrS family aminotransferase [Planctomycetales bacterium]|nr:DegT/DnrJ/EryC1/StrS family aminotransferase [Planctomycetales bacterium]
MKTPQTSTETRIDHVAAPTRVPLLDMERELGPLMADLVEATARVLASGRYVFGPECGELESSIAQYCGAEFGVACASGSDALLLALMALDIKPGDEVIVPSFTFFATASAVTRLGATPVFVDIDPATFNIDPHLVEVSLTARTKAIIPVHLFGQCADMDSITQLARQHGIFVIEDAAQAIGARTGDRSAGSLGDLGCFSFYPTKNLGGCGDGGMITTSNEALASRLRLLRGHGMHPRYFHQAVGINSRLDTIQAAILQVKLPHLPAWTRERQSNAARYDQMFRVAGLDQVLTLPMARDGYHHVWNQYTVRVADQQRDALRLYLSAAEIGTEIYYPVPLHRQECFSYLGYNDGDLPDTERAAGEVMSLPIFPGLTEKEQQTVVDRIARFFFGAEATTSSSPARPKYLTGKGAARENTATS